MKLFGFFVGKSKRLMALVIVLILLTSAVGVVSGYESGGGCIAYLDADPDRITADGKSTSIMYFKAWCPGKYRFSAVPSIGTIKLEFPQIVPGRPSYATYTAPTTQKLGDYKGVTITFYLKDDKDPNVIIESKSVTISLVPEEAVENCENYCKEKFDKEQPASLGFIEGKGEYPFCYCICMDEQTGEEVICWKEDWDCEKYCSEMYKNKQWDSISEWPYCQCICNQGYEEREKEGCVPCNEICRRKGGKHCIEDKEKSEPNSCACKCEDGYDDSYSEKCEKVECPLNSTNVAELGGSCPKDREKLNRHCCCDAGYVKWYGVCIKEEDVPGKVVCGKWGCQEGEDCLNCPQDCECIPPEICDPFSEYANPETGCSPDVAYIFISSGISKNDLYWLVYKINKMGEYYRSRGYETHIINAGGGDELVECLSNPSTKAIAYFGHAGGPISDVDYYLGLETVTPTIEDQNSLGLQNAIYGCLLRRYSARMDRDEAKNRANDRSTNPNLDYAYVHACYSLDDRSLADYLVRSGGTYWGEDCGRASAIGWLDEYIKP